jgi:hypothetical protein
MNILITEEQYNILFRPQVEVYLIEGEEAQKFLDLSYIDDLPSIIFENEENLNHDQKELVRKNNEIETSKLPNNVKDNLRLKLFDAHSLVDDLQKYAESKYNCEIDGNRFYCNNKKKFRFKVSKHWVVRLFRDPLNPIKNKQMGIDLFFELLPQIFEYINQSNITISEKQVILLKNVYPVYNQVISINRIPNLNKSFEVTFITQMEGDYLKGKYKLRVLSI